MAIPYSIGKSTKCGKFTGSCTKRINRKNLNQRKLTDSYETKDTVVDVQADVVSTGHADEVNKEIFENLCMITLNINGIRGKIERLSSIIYEQKADVVVLNEVRVGLYGLVPILKGYKKYACLRESARGGTVVYTYS